MGIRTLALALMVRERGPGWRAGLPHCHYGVPRAMDWFGWHGRLVGSDGRPDGRTRASTIDAMHARAGAALLQLFGWYHP